jgi:3'-phosphoadenosine 5'-phosphosulfate (PAPS) 3'-phosphatase
MTPGSPAFQRELDTAIHAATVAGRLVQEFYEQATASVYTKADASLVTDADLAADRIIRTILAEHFPADPILTEEGTDDPTRLASSRCWIVDPIDGTQQFVDRTDQFDVLVALVVAGRPVVAAGYQPPTRLLCVAAAGAGAWTLDPAISPAATPLRLDPIPSGLSPRLATSTWLGAPENVAALSRVADRLSLEPPVVQLTGLSPRIFLPRRACDALIGFRVGANQAMASEWDFAVADLFLTEAGGAVSDLWGEMLRYNKPDPINPYGIVASADPISHARILAALRPELPPR